MTIIVNTLAVIGALAVGLLVIGGFVGWQFARDIKRRELRR